MTDLINVSANDPLLMDAAVKRSGSRLQGDSRLPVPYTFTPVGKQISFDTLFYFHAPLTGFRGFADNSSLAPEIRGGAGLFLIQHTLRLSFLSK